MKAFVLLICCCACASAQFQSSFGQNQIQSRQRSRGGDSYQQNINQLGQYQQAQQQQQNEYQQPSAPLVSSGHCQERNERYAVSGSCDKYIECVNGTSEEKLCPDGLRFNPNVGFKGYPCVYPQEYQCLERSALQPAQPTENCPNQFGYYKIGDARNCSGFRSCVNGMSFDFTCPEGLAYSSESYRCEWPDQVADCDAEAFLGFRCPEIPITKELGPPAGYRFYRSSESCQRYFICIEGRPRLLTCGGNSAFDELTSACVSADEVDACPADLRQRAFDARDDEKQRLAKELSFTPKLRPRPEINRG